MTPRHPPHALIAIGRDGEVRQLVEAGGDSAVYAVSAAPDGSAVVYSREEGSNVLPAVSYWRVGVNGGAPEQLSGEVGESYGGQGVAWSPDGETILVGEVSAPYIAGDGVEWSRWNAMATKIVAVDRAGQRTGLLTSFAIGVRLIGWAPESAVAPPVADESTDPVVFTAPEKVSDVPNGTRLDSGSAASDDGAK